MLHSNHVLIEIARTSSAGWVKELCYQTIIKDGLLDDESLEKVFEAFVLGRGPITPEPDVDTDELPLCLTGLHHISGVNSLKEHADLKFCEEGVTLLYGTNGSGKSSYFRVLNHLSGKPLAKPVLPNIYAAEEKSFACNLSYRLGDGEENTFLWDNTDATKGIRPFNKIAVFDSNYAGYYVKEHDPDTYVLEAYGYFQIDLLKRNYELLRQRVLIECPEKEDLLVAMPHTDVNVDGLYNNYVTALKIALEEEVGNLIKKDLMIEVNHHIREDRKPVLTVKLRRPYPIVEVLSEAELKSLALGLFIAEQKLKNSKSVIVLDDPVNSLDNFIIERFVERILDMDNQVIMFTHNMRLVDLIYKSRRVVCYSPSTAPNARTDSKKHVTAYQIYSRGVEKGVPVHYGDKMSAVYLKWAHDDLKNEEFDDRKASQVADNLRHAIEYLVDEKVFMGLSPCKHRGRYDDIPWGRLTLLRSVEESTIDCLRIQYRRLSNGNVHLGRDFFECPMEPDELEEIYNALKAL